MESRGGGLGAGMSRKSRSIVAALAVGLVGLIGVASAQAQYTPPDQPGPPLSPSQANLDASLSCTPGVQDATTTPVLLNPATGVTARMNYAWNWERALNMLGIPWCAYTAPNRTLNDIQVSGEYIVHAIRKMHTMAGREIAIMGHSQGGMSMRWALRFWPDTREMVDDVIGFAGSNHGTTGADCPFRCWPALWQQTDQANFIAALNSFAETFAGISYTNVYTHNDQVVRPALDDTGSSSLHTGDGLITNVATQDVCPGNGAQHLTVGTTDPVAYAIAVDALTHEGPADESRIDPAICTGPNLMPGVNPLNVGMYVNILAAGLSLATIPLPFGPAAEPPLKCYVLASCAL